MKSIKSLASGRPLIFALLAALVFVLMVLVSSVVANAAWAPNTSAWYTGSTVGRLVSIFVLLVALARLDWLEPAGFTRLGHPLTWLILLLPLGYAVAGSAYAMTGGFSLNIPDLELTGAAAVFLLAHAFLEEAAFRGLILQALAGAWGDSKRGLVKSVLISSLFFGAYHILYLAAEPLPVVLLRMVTSFLLGIILGSLVWSAESIYPAVIFHAVLNIAGYLNLSGGDIEPAASSWLLLSLLILPVAAFYLYRLFKLSRFSSSLPAQPARPILRG